MGHTANSSAKAELQYYCMRGKDHVELEVASAKGNVSEAGTRWDSCEVLVEGRMPNRVTN